MPSELTEQQVKQIILRELPAIVQSDQEVREFILRLSREQFADKRGTESRFDRLLDELRRDREEQARKWNEEREAQKLNWDEQKLKWAENSRKWEENSRKWDEARAEDSRKWEENNRKWDEAQAEDRRKWEENSRKWDEAQAEDRRKWEENSRKWDEAQAEDRRKWEENARRWEEQTQENHSMLRAIQRHNQSVGALGARWGLSSEESFRNGLRGILESSFNVTVENYSDRDEAGDVFGHPDQVELDVIVKNGLLILCELKSSMSKSDMYVFERKRRFYEKRHNRTATRALVISPMVDATALPVAKQFGIEVYSSAFDLPPAVSEP